jgi:hypothetical protein
VRGGHLGLQNCAGAHSRTLRSWWPVVPQVLSSAEGEAAFSVLPASVPVTCHFILSEDGGPLLCCLRVSNHHPEATLLAMLTDLRK